MVAVSSATVAGPNPGTTLILHAVETAYGPCEIGDPCDPGPPTIDITSPGEPQAIYLLLRNYDNVTTVQCAFDWPQDWTFFFGLWDCLPGQLSCTCPTGPGPTQGTLATPFSCITGGSTAVLGRMHFSATPHGCIEVIESSYPFGTHVVSCGGWQVDIIQPAHRGRVCVGPGGINTCEPTATPVEPISWGRIKRQYQ
jgi:hypothetical protein